MSKELRSNLIGQCKAYVIEKIDRIDASIHDLEKSLGSETKSSAGDKFETGREMINIEINKLSVQKAQFSQLQQATNRLPEEYSWEEIRFGAVVKTSQHSYFISIPAGELEWENEKFYAVGVSSPVAQALIGRKKNEMINFNGKEFSILEIQ